jgi:hypothetical protein
MAYHRVVGARAKRLMRWRVGSILSNVYPVVVTSLAREVAATAGTSGSIRKGRSYRAPDCVIRHVRNRRGGGRTGAERVAMLFVLERGC